jgi:AraC-like DNA-binding protein
VIGRTFGPNDLSGRPVRGRGGPRDRPACVVPPERPHGQRDNQHEAVGRARPGQRPPVGRTAQRPGIEEHPPGQAPASEPDLAEGATVTEAAHRCGWATTSAFIDVFTQTMGQTPGTYRAAPAVGRPARQAVSAAHMT